MDLLTQKCMESTQFAPLVGHRHCGHSWLPTVAARGLPVGNVPDERSPVAKAAAWAARILTVALEMVLPGLFGSWVDQKLGTVALFMLIGLGLGFFVAAVHLMQMLKKID